MYGSGLIYIKKVDIWEDKLRLTIFDSVEDSEMYVFMHPKTAHSLICDISLNIGDYRNKLVQERMAIRKKVIERKKAFEKESMSDWTDALKQERKL